LVMGRTKGILTAAMIAVGVFMVLAFGLWYLRVAGVAVVLVSLASRRFPRPSRV
jgi:uncharacterized membrane protein